MLAADLDDVVSSRPVGGELARRGAPVGIIAVVDDVVCAELLEGLGLGGGGGGRDYLCASCFGELCGRC